MGHSPGLSRTIVGCMGQKYSAWLCVACGPLLLRYQAMRPIAPTPESTAARTRAILLFVLSTTSPGPRSRARHRLARGTLGGRTHRPSAHARAASVHEERVDRHGRVEAGLFEERRFGRMGREDPQVIRPVLEHGRRRI